jgi:D-alanyl-lipoteichoic acid acyltransferase DltB (MBOAT superfamily)
MAGMSLWAYFCALMIGKLDTKLESIADGSQVVQVTRQKNMVTGLAIIVEVVILIVLQDNAFFVDNINRVSSLLNLSWKIPIPTWAVPLGISYYTLMLIGYLLDTSWKISKPQKNPLKLLLFTCYFPQMISGPFTRYHEMEDQLYKAHTFDHTRITSGAQRILWGLFKKLVIAERLSVIVGTIYGNYEEYPGFYVLIAIVGYTLQVYADFSGCMDIIIGISELFGVKLPENFHTPFYATNLSEVWRRWHMTLGFWVKDYVLYPFLKSSFAQKIGKFAKKRWSKKAAKRIPTYCGMFLTWFTVGFWHGGSWNYILGSGMFFFVMIVGGMLLEPVFNRLIQWLHINTECFSWKLFQRIRTFFLFAASVSFGRASSTASAVAMWKNAFSEFNPWIFFDKSLYNLGVDQQDFGILVFSLLLFLVVSILQQKGSIRKRFAKQNIVFRWIVLFGLIFSILIFGYYGPGYDASEFIYGGF